jgi:hypothetical protein
MTYPAAIEAQSWLDAWTQLRALDVTSCADASRVIAAWTFGVGETAWPNWYQYGALAYGWSPDDDRLHVSSSQAARPYPLLEELWSSMRASAITADETQPGARSWVQFDSSPGDWGDPTWIGLLRLALTQDGAHPTVVGPELAPDVRKPDRPKTGQFLPVALILGVIWWSATPRRRR